MKMMTHIEQRTLSTIAFSLFFGWLLSFPFEGRILYALAARENITGTLPVVLAIGAHFLGLVTCGFFVKQEALKKTLLYVTGLCIAGSLVYFFPYSGFWALCLVTISFLAGLFVGRFGFYLKKIPPPQRG